MDRDQVMHAVEGLFDREACVSREEILARIDRAPDICDDDKRILGSLWEDDCYTREKFQNALDAYGWRSPYGYGSTHGGF